MLSENPRKYAKELYEINNTRGYVIIGYLVFKYAYTLKEGPQEVILVKAR